MPDAFSPHPPFHSLTIKHPDTAFRRVGIAKTPQSGGSWHPEPGPFPDSLPLRAPGEGPYS